MKAIQIKVKPKGWGDKDAWREDCEIEDDEDSKEWAEYLVNWFNKTLRPGERERELMEAIEAG